MANDSDTGCLVAIGTFVLIVSVLCVAGVLVLDHPLHEVLPWAFFVTFITAILTAPRRK